MNGIEQSARGVLAVFGRVGGHCVFLSNAIHPRRNFRGLFSALFSSLFSLAACSGAPARVVSHSGRVLRTCRVVGKA
jgi:hypothetical protein